MTLRGCIGTIEPYRPLVDDVRGNARAAAFRHGATFLSVGLHERDPMRVAVRGIPRMTFHSVSRLACLIDRSRGARLLDDVPYEDFALV